MELPQEHALGSSSARSFLLTILGELVLGQETPVWTATLIEALGTVGIDRGAARQAIARAAGRGLLVSERVGRRSRWHLTGRAEALLQEGTDRIFSLHHRSRQWDGRWVVLLLASVPAERPAAGRDGRDRLRAQLGWVGFGQPAPGVWVCPWVERADHAERVLAELGLRRAATLFVGGRAPLDDARAVAEAAWDLPALDGAYERFLARYCGSDGPGAKTPAGAAPEAFAELVRLVHAWRQLPMLDPDLPSGLLPQGWSGDAAAQLFHRLHTVWKPAARDWWEHLPSGTPAAGGSGSGGGGAAGPSSGAGEQPPRVGAATTGVQRGAATGAQPAAGGG